MPASLLCGELTRQLQIRPIYKFHRCMVNVLVLRGPVGKQNDGEGATQLVGCGRACITFLTRRWKHSTKPLDLG